MKKKIRLAIISPNHNAYSETFIQNHRKIADVEVYFYYGAFLPLSLEGKGEILNDNLFSKIFRKILVTQYRFRWSELELGLIKSFRKNRIECVLAEYGPTASKLWKICNYMDIPLISHFFGYDAYVKDVLKKNELDYQEVFKYSYKVVAVSTSIKNNLIKLGCSENKIIVNPCGPQEFFFDIKPKYDKKLLVALGRFVDKKAPYYTVLAFKKALEKHPDAKLYMFGDGVLFNTIKNLISYHKLNKSIFLPGVVTQSEYLKLYKNARAFIQHSIKADDGDMEGTPVAILEASAAGLPVISTYHAGISDVVAHERTGLLVEEHDVEGMAFHIVNILDELDYARKLGQNGRKWIYENFTLEKHLTLLSKTIFEAVHSDQ